MGKIKMKGYATRTISADLTEYNVSFSSVNIVLEEAVARVSNNVESFLKGLINLGFEMKDIHASDTSTSDVTIGQKPFKKAYRSMSFTTNFNPVLENRIFDIIKAYKSEASISVNYEYSTENDVYVELLTEAVKDSKKKAALVAGVNNEEVRAIESASDDYYDEEEELVPKADIYYKMGMKSEMKKRLSDELSAPVKDVEREIYVTWEVV